jgi:tRNA threonylcarbamoyladenosine biosynthesis protein TsaE
LLTLDAADPVHQEQLGAALARVTPAACVIYLQGDLGAGKTTLVRGFLRGMGYSGRVKSPTYTLLEPYQLESGMVYHFDLYRLADAEELEYLGLRDLLATDAVILFEWPERGQGGLPDADILVRIDYQGDGRRLALSAASGKGEQVLEDLRRELLTQVK